MDYKFRAAGVTMEGRQEMLKNLQKGTLTFQLKREPDNPYDPNAVAILTEDGSQKIGYVPRGTFIPEKMNAGVKFATTGFVIGGDNGKNFGVALKCEMLNDNDSYDISCNLK